MSLDKMDNSNGGRYLKLLGFGFFLWLIPFLISFLFFDPQGKLAVGVAFFNSIMSVVLALVTIGLLLSYLKKITVNYLNESIKAGIVWLVMSLVLDLVVLVPMARMDLSVYIAEIGIGYLVIPMIAVFAGLLLEKKSEHNKKIFSQVFSTEK